MLKIASKFGARTRLGTARAVSRSYCSAGTIVASMVQQINQPGARRGAFILFEGADRCGKTTQTAKLADALRERGVSSGQHYFGAIQRLDHHESAVIDLRHVELLSPNACCRFPCSPGTSQIGRALRQDRQSANTLPKSWNWIVTQFTSCSVTTAGKKSESPDHEQQPQPAALLTL